MDESEIDSPVSPQRQYLRPREEAMDSAAKLPEIVKAAMFDFDQEENLGSLRDDWKRETREDNKYRIKSK